MSDPRGTHNDLHSERGALAGEHSGRATNPVIKVHDLAWLGFQKPDLARAETFAHAFGFAAVVRTASDAMAAGGQYLIDQGYYRSWGIGRHIQGSQIFDYWRDPDGFLVEHFADGDRFDCTLEPGWAPMTASGLAQWGPPVTRDFLGVAPGMQMLSELRGSLTALREDNEFDLSRLSGLMKVARS